MIQKALLDKNLNWKSIELKKGEYLTRAGEVENHIYYIISGAVRAYTIIEETEITIRFGYTNSIINSLSSYFTSQPSEIYLQTLRKTDVYRCHRIEFEKYINSSKELLQEYNTLLKESIVGIVEREIDLMHTSPKTRIERLLKRSPQLFQEVPQKYIAAYLRMSPETLSRLLKT